MLYHVDWAEDGTYRPGEYNSPEKFFDDGLKNSSEFDLQLGYFSSATISVLAEGFATFVSNGGTMRLVINNIVSDKDKEAISKGIHGGIIDCFDLSNFEELRKTFDEYQQQFFDCLAYLIYRNRIDIRIIKPRNKNGIAHTKSGQFRDGDSVTSFTGSANFTISGLFNNLEEIKIDRSDSIDTRVQKRIESQREEFDSIMHGTKKRIEYLSPDKLISAIKSKYGDKDIDELLDVEVKLKKLKRSRHIDPFAHESFEEKEPCFPYPSGPREYQQLAFDNWRNNGQKGLFAMATGTGKTITSLNCLLEIYKRCGYYKAIILVPTITLVNQWEQECRKFHFGHIVKLYSKNSEWKEQISHIKSRCKFRKEGEAHVNYIIISTYASFARDSSFKHLLGFEEGKLLLIADEAHNMGSPTILKRLKDIPYHRRIGLSATPERQYDEDTNKRVFAFFGAEEKYTYEYSMREAIENGVLCRYNYYPHVVQLNDIEMNEYVDLSLKIAKYFNSDIGTFTKKDDILTALLLARKRIIHKAENKLEIFRKIIQERFKQRGDLKYTLVYVPEGVKPDYLHDDTLPDETNEVDDDYSNKLINRYTDVVKEVGKFVTVRKFVSGEKDRDKILSDFASGQLQVLTSMKCLDEGVDVPRSELAIFCSSTGNPRQFIQRRGRILRTHPDKYMATIHDLVVVPEINSTSDSFKMERNLLKGELERVKNFALLSENSVYSLKELHDIMEHYGLNLFNNDHI